MSWNQHENFYSAYTIWGKSEMVFWLAGTVDIEWPRFEIKIDRFFGTVTDTSAIHGPVAGTDNRYFQTF